MFIDIHEGFRETAGFAGDWAELPLPELIMRLTSLTSTPFLKLISVPLKPVTISRWLVLELNSGSMSLGLQVRFFSFPS